MRVLHVNEHLSPKGGVETYLLSLLPHLEREGVATGFAYAAGDASLVHSAFHVPMLAEASRRAIAAGRKAMEGVLERFRPDVVHVHGVHNVGAIDACLRFGPVVLTSHDYRYACPASNFYYRRGEERCQRTCSLACFGVSLRRRCMTLRPAYAARYYHRVRWSMRNAGRFAHVVAPSGAAAERMIAAGFPESRTTVLPYFCRVAPVEAPRPVPERARVLFLGRVSENKGWRYFVRALGRLPSDVQGTLVGNIGPQTEPVVRAEALAAGCADRLEARPWAGEGAIVDLLKTTSVLVFPSLWDETLGLVGLEALSQGVPVVASDVGGVREWLRDGETGLLARPGDAEGLASGISRILDSRELAERMGQTGIDLVRRSFGAEQHVARLMAIYDGVCGAGARAVLRDEATRRGTSVPPTAGATRT